MTTSRVNVPTVSLDSGIVSRHIQAKSKNVAVKLEQVNIVRKSPYSTTKQNSLDSMKIDASTAAFPTDNKFKQTLCENNI